MKTIKSEIKEFENHLEIENDVYKKYEYTNYYINKNGDCIRYTNKPVFLKRVKNINGYEKYYLNNGVNVIQEYIHRMVWNVWSDEKIKCELNHKDHNKSNNNFDNLEQVTHSENMLKYYEAVNNGYVKLRKRNTYKSIQVVVIDKFSGDRYIYPNSSAASLRIKKYEGYISAKLRNDINFDDNYLFFELDDYNKKGYDLLSPLNIVKIMIKNVNFV